MISHPLIDEYIELWQSGKITLNKERIMLIEYLQKYILTRDDVYFEKEVKKEKNRLTKLFKGHVPDNQMKLIEGLIIQASRLRILMNDAWVDICENGRYEYFSQSEKMEPYERERPIVKQFATYDKSYQAIIKQLAGYLPPEVEDKLKESAQVGSDLL